MASPAPEVVSIRRYPNRRLYDRQSRRYITLQDLEDLVKAGKKIEVRDSKTNEDLTRAILTQILIERHPEKMEMFPVAMLHGILQANDMVLDFFRAYLRQSLAILEQVQKPATPLTPFFAPMDWMRAMMPPTLPFPMPIVPESGSAPAHSPDLDARLSEIEERIRLLEEPVRQGRKGSRASAASHQDPPKETDGAALDRLEERLNELEGRHKGAAG
jgi:polyhydroxyalkanoate synthesis repressor PhaR